MLPKTKPSLEQALLSLEMPNKTGSSDVTETWYEFSHGVSYTETLFIEGKWEEYS